MNTLALELLRKISKKNSLLNLDANNWLISFYQNPNFWLRYPFLKINKKGGKELFNKLKVNNFGYTSLMNFYKLNSKLQKFELIFEKDFQSAFSKNPFERNSYEKELINLIEKINIFYKILKGDYINILPNSKLKNFTWKSWIKKKNILYNKYISSLFFSKKKNKWEKSNKILDYIIFFQKKKGGGIIPSDKRIKLELIYNKLNINFFLMVGYSLLGIIILFFAFIKNFFFKKNLLRLINLFFIYHTLGLIIRWYISFHAPWSNEYESLIFISWCILFAGILISKNRNLIIPGLSCLVASIILYIAYINLINPEITNLVPVLKSYWLVIHVTIITSSYGFLCVSSLIGLLVIIIFIINKFLLKKNIKLIISDLTIINELSMIIGLFLLTIGTFLGAIWANESWGSYWNWDPKETWALISILIYVLILHMRLIPFFKGKYIFNIFSFLSIISIIITYFGVNYYFAGLHSYAKGENLNFFFTERCYKLLILILILIIIFFYKKKKSK
ncbi:cytochrome c biogenesis protein [Candidatus Karelsulcia muelleri]|uniref:cytochrome c biogenesis protein n=1 Tax=Candidatus Karelsulcia muelleri TaxID=336810 RepID=UPI000D7BC10B|nr:cytochrome c biogenesis protein CcsA [Candidatus Karelsulcia muelleri]